MTENLMPYDRLVFHMTGKASYVNLYARAKQDDRENVKAVIDEYDGFMDIQPDGGITVINPKDILANRLIAYTNRLGFSIDDDGGLFTFLLPVKVIRESKIRIDYDRLQDAYDAAGVRVSTDYKIKTKENSGEITYSRQSLEGFPDRERLIKIFREVLDARIRHMVSTTRLAMCNMKRRISETESTGMYAVESNLLRTLAREYNISLMFNKVFKDFITELPEESETVLLARRIASQLPIPCSQEWMKNNITDTMKKEQLDTSPVLPLITRIGPPCFERMPENKDTATFDQIRMRLGLVTRQSVPDRDRHLKRYRRELAMIALSKIKDAKQFQRYGIPVNFLRADHMTITVQDEIEIVFVLKDLS